MSCDPFPKLNKNESSEEQLDSAEAENDGSSASLGWFTTKPTLSWTNINDAPRKNNNTGQWVATKRSKCGGIIHNKQASSTGNDRFCDHGEIVKVRTKTMPTSGKTRSSSLGNCSSWMLENHRRSNEKHSNESVLESSVVIPAESWVLQSADKTDIFTTIVSGQMY